MAECPHMFAECKSPASCVLVGFCIAKFVNHGKRVPLDAGERADG